MKLKNIIIGVCIAAILILPMLIFEYDTENFELRDFFILALVSGILSYLSIKYFSDVLFYFFFACCAFLSIFTYIITILNSWWPDDQEENFNSLFDTNVLISLGITFLLSVIALVNYHNHRDEGNKSFEIAFSAVICVFIASLMVK